MLQYLNERLTYRQAEVGYAELVRGTDLDGLRYTGEWIASSAKTPLIVVSLAQYHGRQVAVDLAQRSKDGEETLVEWRAIDLADQSACKLGRASLNLPWQIAPSTNALSGASIHSVCDAP